MVVHLTLLLSLKIIVLIFKKYKITYNIYKEVFVKVDIAQSILISDSFLQICEAERGNVSLALNAILGRS